MKIIGEKINGTRKSIKEAVLNRDVEFIQKLACSQAEAGSTWIDVNAGTSSDREPEDLAWLVETVEAAVDKPLCLDSANPVALATALPRVKKAPLINSISGETSRLTGVLPLAAQAKGGVIALAMDDKGIPATTDGRLAVVQSPARADPAGRHPGRAGVRRPAGHDHRREQRRRTRSAGNGAGGQGRAPEGPLHFGLE